MPPRESVTLRLTSYGHKETRTFVLTYGNFIEVKDRHYGDPPYWEDGATYKLNSDPEILQDVLNRKAVSVKNVGHFDSKEAFIAFMQRHFSAKAVSNQTDIGR